MQCTSWPYSGSLTGEVGRDTLVERAPARAGIGALENAADGDADVEVPGIARIDVDRVQRRAAGRPWVLLAADPRRAHRVGVESRDAVPGDAAVLGAEQARRRDARVPRAGRGRVPGRKPENVNHREPFFALRGLGKGR